MSSKTQEIKNKKEKQIKNEKKPESQNNKNEKNKILPKDKKEQINDKTAKNTLKAKDNKSKNEDKKTNTNKIEKTVGKNKVDKENKSMKINQNEKKNEKPHKNKKNKQNKIGNSEKNDNQNKEIKDDNKKKEVVINEKVQEEKRDEITDKITDKIEEKEIKQEENKIVENHDEKQMIEKSIEQMSKYIEKKKKIPKEEMNKICRKLFPNLLLAIGIIIYYIFILLGAKNIEETIFITDLKVFSIVLMITSIIIFETGYKKDSGKFAIYGIEILLLAISTFASVYIKMLLPNIFMLVEVAISLVFSIYYITKCIVIYIKARNNYYKSINDIEKIVKDDRGEEK